MDATTFNASPLQHYLEELHHTIKNYREGEVASYIPELLLADPEWFGITIATLLFMAWRWKTMASKTWRIKSMSSLQVRHSTRSVCDRILANHLTL